MGQATRDSAVMTPGLLSVIVNFVFFDIGVSLSDPAWAAVAPTRYWTQIAVCNHIAL
jgi:hypothetical protein